MSRISERLPKVMLLAAACAAARAAAEPPTAAVNIVVAPGVRGTTRVFLNGAAASRDGYGPGDCSGGLLVPAGTLDVATTNGMYAASSPLRMPLPPGASALVVVFATPEADAPLGAAPGRLALAALPHREFAAARSVTAVYLGAAPARTIEAAGRLMPLPFRQPLPLFLGAAPALAFRARPASAVTLRLGEPGHYWLILDDDPDGRPGHLLVFDPKYERPAFD